MPAESITISFVATTKIKKHLETWAKADDRSISYVLRKILEREHKRRMKAQSRQTEES